MARPTCVGGSGSPQTAAIRIDWPTLPTITTPAGYDALLATVTHVLAEASIELAGLRASGRKL